MDSTLSMALGLAVFFSLTISLISITGKAKVTLQHVFSSSFCLYIIVLIIGNAAATFIVVGMLDDKGQSAELRGADKPANQTNEVKGPKETGTNQNSGPDVPKTPDPVVPSKGLKAKLPGPVWMWAAFFGVFGFQVILTRINVTMFGQGVLTIEDWIKKAEENAVATASDNFNDAKLAEAQGIAKELAKLSAADLNTHVTTYLGPAVLKELEDAAAAGKSNPALLKAQALASQKPKEAKAIIG